MGTQLHTLLTLALDGDWSTSSPIPFPPEPMNSLGGPQGQSQCFNPYPANAENRVSS